MAGGLEPYFVNVAQNRSGQIIIIGPLWEASATATRTKKNLEETAFEIKRRRCNQNITLVCFQCHLMSFVFSENQLGKQ